MSASAGVTRWHPLERRSGASALQITALGIGLMCLLLIAMTRNDLIAGWRQSTPPDAPNEFIIDIQPDQREAVAHYLSTHGFPGTELSPMVRGRLLAINGKPVDPGTYKSEDARRLVDREFNLSYTTTLPGDNRIVGGQWYGDAATPQISIEQGLAKTIGVKPGDTLRFDVTGLQVDAPVTSVRKLDWGSFKVNFLRADAPAALQDFPATFITSFHLPEQRRTALDDLIAAYPNLTAIDVAPVLAQLQRVLLQVIGAVQFLFLFTPWRRGAGVVRRAGRHARRAHARVRVAACARRVAPAGARGADRGIRGGRRSLGADGRDRCAGDRLGAGHAGLRFSIDLNPWLTPAGIAAGVACAGIGGWLGLRRVLSRPALQSLRDA